MLQSVKVDFIDGEPARSCLRNLSDIYDSVKHGSERLYHCNIDNLIELLDGFSANLVKRSNPIHGRFPRAGIPFLAGFCRKRNLQRLLDDAFLNRNCLDGFVELSESSEKEYRAFPKGTVVHWMAGNVPVLGFISLIMGFISKNGNIVKQAAGSDDLLQELLIQLSNTTVADNIKGHDFLKSLAVIRYPYQDNEIGASLSRMADVRVVWGSDESSKSIRALPTKLESNDIVFPNRTSFAIIGGSFLEKNKLKTLTKRIAQDISVFEQKACASPHTILLLTEDGDQVSLFAKHLQTSMQSALKSFPKISPSHREVSTILNLRAQYDMLHQAWYSSGTEYTILSDDLFQLGPSIGNRTIFLRKFPDFRKITEIITPNVQSVGIAVDKKDFDEISSILGKAGVHRITKIGMMTHFDVPWDGYQLLHHLVRWTSRPKAESI